MDQIQLSSIMFEFHILRKCADIAHFWRKVWQNLSIDKRELDLFEGDL